MMPGFHHRNRKNKTESKDERCFYLKTCNDLSSTTHKILLSSGVCSYSADVTWSYRRAPFVGEVPTWGGRAVGDASAAALASAPAATIVSGSGVFPAASARRAASAPASAAVAAVTVTGCGVFPAASARGADGAPAFAAVAAASAAATATAAATAAAAIPPNGARETVAARGGVFPTPPVDWTTARHDQHPETVTIQLRRYQVTPAVTRSKSRRTGWLGAFALLEADEQIVRSLATGPEADSDPELPAALVYDLETPETYTQAHAGPHGRIWGAAERKELAGLTAVGTSKPAGVSM